MLTRSRQQDSFEIGHRVRPLRVAWMLDTTNVEAEGLFVDVLLEAAVSWGGRRWLFVPVSNAVVGSAYEDTLTVYDPDCIVAFPCVGREVATRLTKNLDPLWVRELNPGLGVRASLQTEPLQTRGVPAYLYAREPATRRDREFIAFSETKAGDNKDVLRRFVAQNFGLLRPTVFDKAAYEGLPHRFVSVDEVREGALNSLVRSHMTTPLDLTVVDVDESRDGRFTDYGPVVVLGDSLCDQVYAWNREALIGARRAQTYWVPASASRESWFSACLTRVSTRHGNERLRLRSCSLDAPTALELIPKGIYGMSVDSQLPELRPEHPFEVPRPNREQVDSSVSRPFRHGRTKFVAECPEFIVPHDRAGHYAVDVYVEFADGSIAPSPTWQTPQRAAFARAFLPMSSARITRQGLPSFVARLDERSVEVVVPSDSDLLRAVFSDLLAEEGDPRGAIQISAAGRVLVGLSKLMGSLQEVNYALSSAFWWKIFNELSTSRGQRRERIRSALDGKIAEGELGECVERLARSGADVPTPFMTPALIQTRFNEHQLLLAKAKCESNRGAVERESFEEFEQSRYEEFVEQRVLLLGIERRCPQCGTRRWMLLDDYTTVSACVGCGEEYCETLPEVTVRLNEVVQRAIETDIAPVVRALLRLRRFGPFIPFPCMDVMLAGRDGIYTDLDICCLEEGKLIIGEAKSDPHGFKESDIEKLGTVAQSLLPDRIVLAAVGDQVPEALAVFRAKLVEKVRPFGAAVDVLLLPKEPEC